METQKVTAQTQIGEWHQLTRKDVEYYIRFYTQLRRLGVAEFTSDTFRNLRLDEEMKDTQHEVGMLFAKWKWHRLILPVRRVRSKIESNHKRMITVFKFKTPEETSTC